MFDDFLFLFQFSFYFSFLALISPVTKSFVNGVLPSGSYFMTTFGLPGPFQSNSLCTCADVIHSGLLLHGGDVRTNSPSNIEGNLGREKYSGAVFVYFL